MKKSVFCPNYIDTSSNQEIIDVLYKIPQSNCGVKVAVDSDLAIFDRYSAAPDPLGLINAWMKILIDSFPNKIVRVGRISDIEKSTNQALCMAIAKRVPTNRHIIVSDSDDYLTHQGELKLADIHLIERHQAADVFTITKKFSFEEFSTELVAISHRLTERRRDYKNENSVNDMVVDLLRNRGYGAFDQTRSGKSAEGTDAGELDIAERRKDGVIESIIEAFRLSSCGNKNSVIAEHINKLVHDYDTSGVARSFVLIYAEASRYGALWKSYCKYMENLNDKVGFTGQCKLKNFNDVSEEYACSAKVRVGLATHERELVDLEILHIFINMTY